MLEIISVSGPFGLLSTGLGLVAVAMQITAMVKPGRSNVARAAAILAIASFLVGVVGTGAGLMQVSDAVLRAEPAMRLDLYMRGRCIAETSTTVGAAWAVLNAALFAVTTLRNRG